MTFYMMHFFEGCEHAAYLLCHFEYFVPSLVLRTDMEILFALQHCEC